MNELNDLVERCYWHLQGLYEVEVLKTPSEHWKECYNCIALPVMIDKCDNYISNYKMREK